MGPFWSRVTNLIFSGSARSRRIKIDIIKYFFILFLTLSLCWYQVNDDDLETELTKPPNMAAIFAEEKRIEQLHRRSYDTDSNYEQDSSHERDSGVELGHVEDWTKQPVSPDMSQHSRQSSEPFGASVTSSEEDEITKKEREIIEVLEKEEQWRYGDNREYSRYK